MGCITHYGDPAIYYQMQGMEEDVCESPGDGVAFYIKIREFRTLRGNSEKLQFNVKNEIIQMKTFFFTYHPSLKALMLRTHIPKDANVSTKTRTPRSFQDNLF